MTQRCFCSFSLWSQIDPWITKGLHFKAFFSEIISRTLKMNYQWKIIMMIYVKCIALKPWKSLFIINKLKLKSVQITLKMELMEEYRIGLLTVVIASLGKMYPLVAPLNNITPDFDHPVLDVHSSIVN